MMLVAGGIWSIYIHKPLVVNEMQYTILILVD